MALLAATSLAAVSLDEAVRKIVIVPIVYALGSWIGAVYVLAMAPDESKRARIRDWCGASGGAIGVLFWLLSVIFLD